MTCVCSAADGRGGLEVRLPPLQILLGFLEHPASVVLVLVGAALLAWNHGDVVQQGQHAAAVASEDELLFGPLDGGCEVKVIGLLELLARLENNNNVRKLFVKKDKKIKK